jgi:hypothetical protein
VLLNALSILDVDGRNRSTGRVDMELRNTQRQSSESSRGACGVA